MTNRMRSFHTNARSSLSHHCEDEIDPDHTPTTKDITSQAITIHIETALGHYTGTDTTTTEVAHDDLTQSTEATATTIDLTATHHIDHITVLHNIEALQATDPEITVGHMHDHLTDLQGMNCIDQVHDPAGRK